MFLKSMGYGGLAAVLIAMLAALTIVPVTLVLLALASPFLGVKWGCVDHRVLPEGSPS